MQGGSGTGGGGAGGSAYGGAMPESTPESAVPSDNVQQSDTTTGTTFNLIHPIGLSIHSMPWYHGFMTQREANTLCTMHGKWLVRRVHAGGIEVYFVSVFWKDKVYHIPIHTTKSGTFYFLGNYMSKDPLTLIQFFYEFYEPLNSEGVMLVRHVHRSDWSIRLEQLKIGRKLGHGEFGDVLKGQLAQWNGKKSVAIKKVINNANVKADFKLALLREAAIMQRLRHKHVLRLYGVHTVSDPVMIVLEIAEGNSLKKKLESDNKPGTKDLERYVHEIGIGMAYLESQNVVHKDLAARNCLLDKKNAIKISDFGLSVISEHLRHNKQVHAATKVPFRWMAPETLCRTPAYSSKSDVWSYGVVIYEIYSFGEQPYRKMSNIQIRRQVREFKLRLEAPEGTPEYIASIQESCFKKVEERPYFAAIEDELRKVRPHTGMSRMDVVFATLSLKKKKVGKRLTSLEQQTAVEVNKNEEPSAPVAAK